MAARNRRSPALHLAPQLAILFLLLCSLLRDQPLAAAAGLTPSLADYPLFGFDAGRSSINTKERLLDPGNVKRLVRVWHLRLPEQADSTVIELAKVPGRSGRSTLFVTTVHGTTVALDGATGRVLWRVAAAGRARLANYQITNATPAADPSSRWIYAASPDGRIHKLATTDGQEAAGWPVVVSLHPQDEKIGSALNLYGTTLLIGMGGYIGDFGHYQGKVIAINTRTRAMHVFNAMCSNKPELLTETATGGPYCSGVRSAVWARAGAVVDTAAGSPAKGSIYFATGNGDFNGTTYWGDSVLRLRLTDAGMALSDTYTPENQQALNDQDADLGSTAPILLPREAGAHPWLAIQGGKDSMLRLLDRTNLGGRATPGRLGGALLVAPMPLGGGMFTAGLSIADPRLGTLIYVANGNGIAALRLNQYGGRYELTPAWSWRGQATSPVLANGVLYVEGSNLVQAFDPRTGKALWHSDGAAVGGTIGSVHWQSPTVANGMVIAPDADGAISAYGLR